jgi:hypothetical protein
LEKSVLALKVLVDRLREAVPEGGMVDFLEYDLEVGALFQQHEAVHLEEREVELVCNLVLNGGGGGFERLGGLVLDPPLYLADEFRLLSHKAWVVVIVIGAAALLGKAVHVQLPDVRVHVLVFEVDRQDFRRKCLDVQDNKPIFFLVPANYTTEIRILNRQGTTSSIS